MQALVTEQDSAGSIHSVTLSGELSLVVASEEPNPELQVLKIYLRSLSLSFLWAISNRPEGLLKQPERPKEKIST